MSKSKLRHFNEDSQAWRLTAHFYSPCIYYTPVILDGLILWALNRREVEAEGRPSYTGPGLYHFNGRRNLFDKLHALLWHDGGCAVCTQMLPRGEVAPLRESIKKRFEIKYNGLINFGRHKRRISRTTAPYRNYDKSMPGRLISEASWVFVGDGPSVLDLISAEIIGVGKDVNAGYGWVKDWSLKKSDSDRISILSRRPIPASIANKFGIKGRREVRSWRPPYWATDHLDECVVPDEI